MSFQGGYGAHVSACGGALLALAVVAMLSACSAMAGAEERRCSKGVRNVITEWNVLVESEWAYVHLAQLKVLKAIKDGRKGCDNVSDAAAAAYAGHIVARSFDWKNQESFDELLQVQLNGLRDLPAKERIRARSCAMPIARGVVRGKFPLGDRLRDYYDKQPASPGGPPGVYQLSPDQTFSRMGYMGGAPPMVADEPEAYDRVVPGPPRVPSPEYNAAFAEIRDYGGKCGSRRTAEMDNLVAFMDSLDSYRIWSHIAIQLLPNCTSLFETAFVLACVTIAQADGLSVVSYQKWRHFFWRPPSAIRQGDSQNRPVKDWEPNSETPDDPEHPSGHTFRSAVGMAAMEDYLGTENVTFTLTSRPDKCQPQKQGITRTFRSLSQLNQDMADFRVYAGNHFRFSTMAAIRLAKVVGRQVLRRLKKEFL